MRRQECRWLWLAVCLVTFYSLVRYGQNSRSSSILIRRLNQKDDSIRWSAKHGDHNEYDLPPFSVHLKIIDTSENSDLISKELQQELEIVLKDHIVSVFSQDFPGMPIELHIDRVALIPHSTKETILEANVTGSVYYDDSMLLLTHSHGTLIWALLKRALLTKEEYTRLVDRLHRSPKLPVIRGVKIALNPRQVEFPASAIHAGRSIGGMDARQRQDYQQTELETFRVVALLSFGGLFSVVLLALDLFLRPKRKNYKVSKRKSLFRTIKRIVWPCRRDRTDRARESRRRSSPIVSAAGTQGNSGQGLSLSDHDSAHVTKSFSPHRRAARTWSTLRSKDNANDQGDRRHKVTASARGHVSRTLVARSYSLDDATSASLARMVHRSSNQPTR